MYYENTEAEIIQVIKCSRKQRSFHNRIGICTDFGEGITLGNKKKFRSSHTSELYITMQKHGGMEREGIFNSETSDVAGEVRWKIFSEDKASSFENQWSMKKKSVCF